MKKYEFLIVLLLIIILPFRAVAAELPADGRYTVEVTLSGGSGRAQVKSPAELTVADGTATAVVIWSSPYYEYMLIDGTYYYPVNTEKNSTFEIPVSLDRDMAISAQTVAMSEPHEIDYTLRFDSHTLKPSADGGNRPAAPDTKSAALIILIIAALLFAAVKAKQRNKKRNKENRV